MKARHFLTALAGGLIVLAAHSFVPRPVSAATARPASKFHIDPARSRLAAVEVMGMGPDEWRERFVNEKSELPPETKVDILTLADGLQESLASGADPRSEEARVYVDAIRELLDYRGEE